ncbi:hypothetical protein NMY22_g8913 [Coprinellus aureogranulatus]|nr:hypothetical protein NMY22_g8913 [Coprinellus aureogranulatus]
MSYNAPSLPHLVLTATFLALLPVASHLSVLLTNTDILGPLTLGILWCSPFLPPPAPLLPQSYLPFLSYLGYVGLLLLIFDAGISTPTSLLLNLRNLAASVLVGLTGILVPIALGIALFHGAFGFPVLTAFAAGAALCSTSLGTTVSLLSGQMKKSRVGAVLMSAALLDDVVGLVIAGVIENLVPDAEGHTGGEGGVEWRTIVRPVLVSVAYALGTPVLAVLSRILLRSGKLNVGARVGEEAGEDAQGDKDAWTSELFGAYLAGAFLGYVFEEKSSKSSLDDDDDVDNPILTTFNTHISRTLLVPLLSPLFFASIGASIPVNQFFTIALPGGRNASGAVEMVRSHRVVWRGIVYSVLMILAKTVTGVWVFLFWRRTKTRGGVKDDECTGNLEGDKDDENITAEEPTVQDGGNDGSNVQATPSSGSEAPEPGPPSRPSIALLLGLAMVARGEIALIVAQLARPLLVVSDAATGTDSEEPFVIVMWAVMLTTFGGALGVGWVIRATRDRDWSVT